MNWDAIGAIGEIIGAIAVVVTLAYLAIQVRHAKETAQRTLHQNKIESLREMTMTVLSSESLSGTLTKFYALDDAEFPGTKGLPDSLTKSE